MLMDWANSNDLGEFTMIPDIAGIPMIHEGNSDSWVSVDKFVELYMDLMVEEEKNGK